METDLLPNQISGRDQSALPEARVQRLDLLASPTRDQNRVERRCTAHKGRGEPSAGRNYEVQEWSRPTVNMRNNEPHQSV